VIIPLSIEFCRLGHPSDKPAKDKTNAEVVFDRLNYWHSRCGYPPVQIDTAPRVWLYSKMLRTEKQ
jgi:hypothetical protein